VKTPELRPTPIQLSNRAGVPVATAERWIGLPPWRRWRERSSAWVVSDIELDDDRAPQPKASGGHLKVLEPWRLDDGVLEPLAYSYTVPQEGG
jgi:hypothetical protein